MSLSRATVEHHDGKVVIEVRGGGSEAVLRMEPSMARAFAHQVNVAAENAAPSPARRSAKWDVPVDEEDGA